MGEEVPINIPPPLKAVLEDDCYRVLRRGKVSYKLLDIVSVIFFVLCSYVAFLLTPLWRVFCESTT